MWHIQVFFARYPKKMIKQGLKHHIEIMVLDDIRKYMNDTVGPLGQPTILCDILTVSRGENRLGGTIGFVGLQQTRFHQLLQQIYEEKKTHLYGQMCQN